MYNSRLTDVNNIDYVAGALSVSTTPVEAKVGANRLENREMVRIYNNDNFITIYYGPSGVTTSSGEPIGPGEGISLPFGQNIAVYIVAASGTVDVRIQEAS